MGKFDHIDAGAAADALPDPGTSFPADFSADEADFAADLRGYFSPESEELPPHYVRTILGDPRQQPVENGFEQKLTYQVFRTLSLPRRPLFELHPARRRPEAVIQGTRRLGRTGATALTSVLLLMVLSLFVAGPSFAAGVRILLGQTGVQQVISYPTGVRKAATPSHPANSGPAAPNRLATLEWLGPSVHGYVFDSVTVSGPTEYSDGPVVELRYVLPTDSHAGSGVLDVREFRVAPGLASVLQVVGDGSVTSVSVNDQKGVYVDGKWARLGMRHIWQPGIKGELIFERDGLIFWIVADQRDGMDQAQLAAAAHHMETVALEKLQPTQRQLRLIAEGVENSLNTPIRDEVLALIRSGSSPETGQAAFVSIWPSDGIG